MVTGPAFWAGKRVFLTGHTGFKGSWLALWLHRLGAEVHGYSLAPEGSPNLYETARISDALAGETIGDIREREQLSAALRAARPDILFHLAAQAFVLRSYRDPVETWSTNVVGTVAVLDALRSVDSVRAAVVVTSDKCYENREWPWGYRETDPMGGHDPYSGSKGAAELATASMRRSYFPPERHHDHGLAIASARAGNVIGGGDWGENRLVPDLMRAVLADQPCQIRNPLSIRPWQHVLDPLSGYMRLAEALWRDGPAFADGWNFGPSPDNAKPVGWIADYVTRKWGAPSAWEAGGGTGAHENIYLKLDISKSAALLGWTPGWSLETSLDRVVEWFQAWRSGADMHKQSLTQIDQFSQGHQ